MASESEPLLQRSPDMSQYPTMFDPQSLVRKGFCPVHAGAPPLETHSLYYEQHGTGEKHVLLINGLNTNSFGWDFQVKSLAPTYSMLVFDNRGCGYSGYPAGRYTTSGMAEDIIVLLDHIGWTSLRQIHVVGASLGGMIAQELALRISSRIASLTLCVTTPGGMPWQNFPPFKGIQFLTTLLLTKEPEQKVPTVLKMLYPFAWLEENAANDPQQRTNRQVQTESYLRRVLFSPKQRIIGHVSQLAAALTHYVSPDKLRRISEAIPKVVILCGDEDSLVDLRHSRDLKASMPEAEFIQWKHTGHGIHSQRPTEFRDLLVRIFHEADTTQIIDVMTQ
ncbi:AB hydrolase-1 domain-containing protein [Mycena venus]|uniref:AB hydrolase-1 domain-containing protein n=1 Tax=Mycena venus TaxID=2733690 RepID=A0A8H7D247_9AGAR|nr:AB hydrolase-1 domain-containing protein [Mycena venus]